MGGTGIDLERRQGATSGSYWVTLTSSNFLSAETSTGADSFCAGLVVVIDSSKSCEGGRTSIIFS